MTRTLRIVHSPNDNGFHQFTVIRDDGRPYLDDPPPIGLNNPLDIIRAVAAFLADADGPVRDNDGIVHFPIDEHLPRAQAVGLAFTEQALRNQPPDGARRGE